MANAFAESPSVRIKVQLSASFVPARFASSSFGIPNNRCFFFPPVPSYLFNCASYRASTFAITLSTIAELQTFLKNASLSLQVDPNAFGLVVNVSLV